MSNSHPKKYGRIEVRQAGENERGTTYEILREGRTIAAYSVFWKFEADVDDIDTEVIGESHLLIHLNAQRLADDVRCSLRLEDKRKEAKALLDYFMFSPVGGVPPQQRSGISHLFLEDEYLKGIREDGPLVLRSHLVQDSLATLLKQDEKRAGEAIQGVYEALLDYAKVEKKPGKRGNIRFKSLGKGVIKRRYRELNGILKIVKEKANSLGHKPRKNNIRDLISEAKMKYYEDQGVDISSLPVDPDDDCPLDGSDGSLVSDLLVNDEVFTEEFLTFTWEPDKFAIRIIGKLLGHTFETMDKYL